MQFITVIFNELLYRPLFNALILLYNWLPGHDFGVSIIILTIGLRVVLFPLSRKMVVAQKKLAQLQPKIKEIQEKHKNDKEAQTRAVMEFYKENKVNPMGGCLPLLVQLPLLIALYQVFLAGLKSFKPEVLYSFVASPQFIDPKFLGLINLSERNIILAVIAGAFQFVYSKISMASSGAAQAGGDKSGDFQKMMQSQMLYMMPVFTVFLTMTLPSGIAVYWIATTLFSIGEFYFIRRNDGKSAKSGNN